MATRVLHGIKFFEQFLKVTTKATFLWSLDEIGLVVQEEMSFKVKVYGQTDARRTPDEKRSQKLTLSLCDRWAKNCCHTDGEADSSIPPYNFVVRGYNKFQLTEKVNKRSLSFQNNLSCPFCHLCFIFCPRINQFCI
jgi:hypothetical protein